MTFAPVAEILAVEVSLRVLLTYGCRRVDPKANK